MTIVATMVASAAINKGLWSPAIDAIDRAENAHGPLFLSVIALVGLPTF